MSKVLIKGNPDFDKTILLGNDDAVIEVAEMFGDTIQGEGVNTGVPATFLRVQHCTLNCGWCVVAGTQILMSDFSYKNIEDVEIGDVVKTYTKKGLIDTAVINTLKRSSVDTVLISTEENEVQCSIDHRFVSYLNHTDSKKIQRRLVQAKDSLHSLVKTIPSYIINVNEDDNYKRGYLKGVLLGDGACNDINRIKLECVDAEMIDTVLQYLEDLFLYKKDKVQKISKQKNRQPYWRCVLTNRSINEELVTIPHLDEMRGFVAGFFDAEGTIHIELSMSQKDTSILELLQTYLNDLNFNFTIQKSYVSTLRLRGGRREIIRFLTFFNPKIKRKFDKIYNQSKFDGLEEVLRVEDIGKQDVFTLTTDQGYYIANNFLSKNCDSNEVWRYGNPYTISEIINIWEDAGFVDKFRDGQHLVLTGGSPLKSQLGLIALIDEFISRHGFKPYIEIENEAVLPAHPKMIEYVDCWNNSPKLKSSGNTRRARYKPEILRKLSSIPNSWFKFVVTEESDWSEIYDEFIKTDLIRRDQIILMPEGVTREELEDTRELTINIAIREGVRFSDRMHIIAWNQKTGV